MRNLSILIPCYNGTCADLVASLQAQAARIERDSEGAFAYEIIVGDDGSTDEATLRENEKINLLPHCRYVRRGKNRGRAAIRNWLAREAREDWLVYVDCDMVARNADFVLNYVECPTESVAYGGYTIGGDTAELSHNLRYRYERRYHKNSDAAERGKNPYQDFHTSNFMVRRDIMLRFPLDERMRHYGYEDVLWGRTMCDNGITIDHIDNPVSFEKFETNADFLRKTEEGVETLLTFAPELQGFSTLLDAALRLRRWRLTPLIRLIHSTTGNAIRHNLAGDNPCLSLFPLYKLGLLCGKPNFDDTASGLIKQ